MAEWSNQLTGALGQDPGAALLVKLQFNMDGIEFERRLGTFFAAARSFSDARELMLASSNIPQVGSFATRDNIEQWHTEVTFRIEQVFKIVHETLYALFGAPQFDPQRARTSYEELLSRLAIKPRSANWVYATTNYDTIAEEVLHEAGFRVAWGERHPPRGEPIIDPDPLLDGLRTTVPVLHLHGRIGWYRRRESEGGQPIAVNSTTFEPGFGTPIVMLPDPNKVYDSDPVINTIWGLFEEALRRARRVLVLGHSLNDDQIVDVIANVVEGKRLAVTVYGHRSDPEQPDWSEDPIIKRCQEKLPGCLVVPIRFGEEGSPKPVLLERWLERSA